MFPGIILVFMRSIYCKPETLEEHAEQKTEKAVIAKEMTLFKYFILT